MRQGQVVGGREQILGKSEYHLVDRDDGRGLPAAYDRLEFFQLFPHGLSLCRIRLCRGVCNGSEPIPVITRADIGFYLAAFSQQFRNPELKIVVGKGFFRSPPGQVSFRQVRG